MGQSSEQNQSEIRQRMRGNYQLPRSNHSQRPMANLPRKKIPKTIYLPQPPINSASSQQSPISAERFSLPRQRRSKVLRRKGLKQNQILENLQSRKKVIAILFFISLGLCIIFIFLTFLQSQRLLNQL